MTDKPTPKEIENLFVEETGFDIDDFPAAIFGFARAALRSWGQPSGAGEVVAWRYRMRGDLQWQYTERPEQFAHADEVQELTTPQPIQAQAGAVPLTVEQVNAILLEAGYGSYNAPVPERAAFISGLRHSERAHGINAKEAGNAE